MNQAAIFRQIAANNGDSLLHALVVERLNHRFRQAQKIVAFNHLAHHGRPHSTGGEADNTVHIADGGDDFFVSDDNPAAATRQAQLGEAHAQHDIRIPQRPGVAENNPRERNAVGVINHQRDAVLVGQRIQLDQLIVGDHVARWVGGAGNADHSRLVRDLQMFEIHVVFKLAFRQQFNVRASSDKQIFFKAGIGVADVLGRQRKQHFTGGSIRATACEEVKQVEKRALTAVCQCNILWFDLPTQFITQHLRQQGQQLAFTLRTVIITKRIKGFTAVQHVGQQAMEVIVHFRNLRGIAAAQHDGARGTQAVIEVFHQAGDARMTGKFVAKK